MADDAYVEEVLGDLLGHTIDQGQLTWLTAAMTNSETTMSVEQGSQIFRGVAEVGEELVYVRSSDATTGVVTLAPFGRGYLGTAKAAWPLNTRVTFSPRFPRARVRTAINNTIQAVYPQLFAVTVAEIPSPDGVLVTHPLPAGAERVLNVKQKVSGTTGFWRTLTRYSVRRDGSTSEVNIMQGIEYGQPIRVTYIKQPTKLGPGDAFTASGLAETAWEAIKFGAMFRLISPQEAGRSAMDSAEGDESSSRKERPTTLARQYYAVHQQLVLDERMRLLSEYEIVNNEEIL